MDTTTAVAALVGVILGGGGIGAFIPFLRFRADKGNVIAVGSEAAVASLTTALTISDRRVSACEAENAMLRVAVEEMKIKVETAEASLRQVSRDLAATKQKLDEILGGTNGTK